MKYIKASQIRCTLHEAKEKLIQTYHNNNSVLDECTLINMKRLYFLSIISIPIRVFDIYSFLNKNTNITVNDKVWSQGITHTHLLLLIFMIGFNLLAYKLKKRARPTAAMHVLQYTAVVVFIAAGIVTAALDQLVTTNITPFLITCTVIGLVFLIRPVVSLLIYLASYTAFHYLVGLYAINQQVLLSNRVNGATAIGLGFLLSGILWNYNYTNIIQKRRIKIQQKQLEQMAYYDSLTELPNRRMFEREFSQMKEYSNETVLIVIDLDNFKDINDSFGHPVGDTVLKQVADLLKKNIRESDTVSRFGGEEFVILLPNTSQEEGHAFAERIREIIMNYRFITGDIRVRLTASFGVCFLGGKNNQSMEECYCLADKALYFAKQRGKNRVELAK